MIGWKRRFQSSRRGYAEQIPPTDLPRTTLGRGSLLLRSVVSTRAATAHQRQGARDLDELFPVSQRGCVASPSYARDFENTSSTRNFGGIPSGRNFGGQSSGRESAQRPTAGDFGQPAARKQARDDDHWRLGGEDHQGTYIYKDGR